MSESGSEPDQEPLAVWRRIPPRHFPKKPRQDRPDSSAFDDDPDGQPMSVVLARLGRDPAEVVAGHPGFGLVAISVETLAANNLTIRPDPLEDEADHALVIGAKTQSVRRAVATSASWVVRPPEAMPPTE